MDEKSALAATALISCAVLLGYGVAHYPKISAAMLLLIAWYVAYRAFRDL